MDTDHKARRSWLRYCLATLLVLMAILWWIAATPLVLYRYVPVSISDHVQGLAEVRSLNPGMAAPALTFLAFVVLQLLLLRDALGKAIRRRFRFCLRTMICLVVAISVLLGWWVNRAFKQRRIVDDVAKVGGDVTYDHEGSMLTPFVAQWMIDRFGEDLFFDVAEIILMDDQSTNGKYPASDATLEQIATLSNLQSLYVSGNPSIGNLELLGGLGISSCPITDAGLASIAKLASLRTLSLSHLPITDAGLAHLHELTKLEALWLIETLVTKQGVADLQKRLPDCQIEGSNE